MSRWWAVKLVPDYLSILNRTVSYVKAAYLVAMGWGMSLSSKGQWLQGIGQFQSVV